MGGGIDFIGIKFILYYAIFYGFGWLAKWTESYWKQWWDKLSNTVFFISLIVFLAIVFNFDMYNSGEDIMSIALRVIAGFAGNAVIFAVCKKFSNLFSKMKMDWIGKYTLEIYVTHVAFVYNIIEFERSFFAKDGFVNFICASIITVLFTAVIMLVFKAIPAADFIFYGKLPRERKSVK